jgi:hypothetical protein
MDRESSAMAMLMAWCDDGYTTSCDPLIVGFQPFDLFQYRLPRRRRWLGTFEGDLWCYLHFIPVSPSRSTVPIRVSPNGCKQVPTGISNLSNIDHSPPVLGETTSPTAEQCRIEKLGLLQRSWLILGWAVA